MTGNSPSNVGSYIRASTVSSKVMLIALSILGVGFIFWCFCGRITDREYVSGVVFPSDGAAGISVPNDGIVREVFVHKGDVVSEGQTLALISISGSYSILSAPYSGKVLSYIPENQSFKAFEDIVDLLSEKSSGMVSNMIAYADYTSARFIRPGQEIQATPVGDRRERIGFVRGRIVSISPYPVSHEEAVIKLQNASLADEIYPEKASAFEVRIELEMEDDGSLRWSFPLKEAVDMSVGTLCNVEVITRSRSIFNYLLENVQETRNTFRLWERK